MARIPSPHPLPWPDAAMYPPPDRILGPLQDWLTDRLGPRGSPVVLLLTFFMRR